MVILAKIKSPIFFRILAWASPFNSFKKDKALRIRFGQAGGARKKHVAASLSHPEGGSRCVEACRTEINKQPDAFGGRINGNQVGKGEPAMVSCSEISLQMWPLARGAGSNTNLADQQQQLKEASARGAPAKI